MTRIPVLPAYARPAPRPSLRTRVRPLARRLSAPLMGVGFLVILVALMSLESRPLLPLLPWLGAGVGAFWAGMRASGQPLDTWIDLGGSK